MIWFDRILSMAAAVIAGECKFRKDRRHPEDDENERKSEGGKGFCASGLQSKETSYVLAILNRRGH